MECAACKGPEVSGEVFTLERISLLLCGQCDRVVSLNSGSGESGGLAALERVGSQIEAPSEPAEIEVSPEPAEVEVPAAAEQASLFVIQTDSSVTASLQKQLSSVQGVDFVFSGSGAAALIALSKKIMRGDPLRAIIFHYNAVKGSGSTFLYALRALEMAYDRTSVPVLVVGKSSSEALTRAIAESKNAKFVGIGASEDSTVIADRYLKIVKKLGGV